MRPTIRRAAAVAVALTLTACGTTEQTPSGHGTRNHRTSTHARSTPVAAPTSVTPPRSATAASGPLATTVLATLRVRTAHDDATGYRRDTFGPAYSDKVSASIPSGHNGCDQRSDIRRRDSQDAVIKRGTGGCVVSSGHVDDPYTGNRITLKASGFEHVVALKDAWISGAAHLSDQQRIDIAGDPLNLLIVTERVNVSKGDKSAAVWLPPNTAFRCAYVARQIAVKARYGLSVTQPEHDRMAAQLATCPTTRTPTSDDVAPPAPRG